MAAPAAPLLTPSAERPRKPRHRGSATRCPCPRVSGGRCRTPLGMGAMVGWETGSRNTWLTRALCPPPVGETVPGCCAHGVRYVGGQSISRACAQRGAARVSRQQWTLATCSLIIPPPLQPLQLCYAGCKLLTTFAGELHGYDLVGAVPADFDHLPLAVGRVTHLVSGPPGSGRRLRDKGKLAWARFEGELDGIRRCEIPQGTGR